MVPRRQRRQFQHMPFPSLCPLHLQTIINRPSSLLGVPRGLGRKHRTYASCRERLYWAGRCIHAPPRPGVCRWSGCLSADQLYNFSKRYEAAKGSGAIQLCSQGNKLWPQEGKKKVEEKENEERELKKERIKERKSPMYDDRNTVLCPRGNKYL